MEYATYTVCVAGDRRVTVSGWGLVWGRLGLELATLGWEARAGSRRAYQGLEFYSVDNGR